MMGPALPPDYNVSADNDDNDFKTKLPSKRNIGPTLPPEFTNKNSVSKEITPLIGPAMPPDFGTNESTREPSIGPSLPPGIGPALPPDIGPALPPDIGPALPPNIGPALSPGIGPALPPGIGPALPPGFGPALPPSIGPALPPGFTNYSDSDEDSIDDDDVVGPMPIKGGSIAHSSAADDFERRAQKMKNKLEGKNEPVVETVARESWMIELPSNGLGKSLGLVSRTFNAKSTISRDADRSAWTDTPADRERKKQEATKGPSHRSENQKLNPRDEKLTKQIDSYNKHKRKESLIDMHQKEMKKAKKDADDDEPKGRREFSRDTDLQVNRFDNAKRKALIKKSQDLNTRFGHGGTTGKFI